MRFSPERMANQEQTKDRRIGTYSLLSNNNSDLNSFRIFSDTDDVQHFVNKYTHELTDSNKILNKLNLLNLKKDGLEF